MPTPLLALVLLAGRTEPPRLLIAPLAPVKKDGPVPSSALGAQIANQLDEDGRTLPIIWGLADTIFRSAALENKLGDVPVLPTRAQALAASRKLGASFVLAYRSEYKDGSLQASAELLRDGQTVWKDSKSMGATLGNARSDDDAAASIARTWIILMTTKDGPLKSLPPKKAVATPDPTPGQAPPKVEEPALAPPVPKNDTRDLEARLAALAKDGKNDAARALARDAVDADPLSPAPRTILVRLLAAQGDAAGAADEARRAADLLPEEPALRTDAVRRLLAIGKTREARDEANELRARMPEDKGARRLAAEVALAEDDAETAVRELEPLLKAGDDPEARLLRGLARARLGGAEGAAADMKVWGATTSDRAEGYAYAQRTLGAMADRAADGILPLLQRAGAQPKSGAVREELDAAQRQAQARAAAWAALPAPDGSTKAHDAWSLAHRLMALVAADLRAYLAGSDDALTAARIDLGEAKRAMKEASSGKE